MAEAKELLDFIKSRRSIRKFEPDMIPEEILEQIMEAGTYAATGEKPAVTDHYCGYR